MNEPTNRDLTDRDLRQRDIIPPDRLAACRASAGDVGAIGRTGARRQTGNKTMLRANLIIACSAYRSALECVGMKKLVELCGKACISASRRDHMIDQLVEKLVRDFI